MTKLIISMSLLLISITAQTTETLPQGQWVVEQVTIEKNTDGNIQTAVYNTAAEVVSPIPCPKEWKIKANTIVLHYLDETEETSEYTFEDHRLMIHAATGMRSYQYSIDEEKLILSITYNYVNSLPVRQTEQIKENWIIVLIRK